jgi:hypothetical protein
VNTMRSKRAAAVNFAFLTAVASIMAFLRRSRFSERLESQMWTGVRSIIVGLAPAMAGFQIPAYAGSSSLPDATGSAYINSQNNNGSDLVSLSSFIGTVSDATGHGTAATSMGPLPSASAVAASDYPDGAATSTETQSNITYYYSISGPPTNQYIPIDIVANYNLTAINPDINTWADFIFETNYSGVLWGASCYDYCSDGTLRWTLAMSGTEGYGAVTLLTQALSSGGGLSTARIDATLYIDPVWAQNNPGYVMNFSDGIVNSVPESKTSALMVAGLIVLSGLIRRRGA